MTDTIITDTLMDVGGWLCKKRICVSTKPDGLLLFAQGKTPYKEHIPFQKLQDSIYNHTTGELVIAPAEEAQTKSLKMSPLNATRILKYIKNKN